MANNKTQGDAQRLIEAMGYPRELDDARHVNADGRVSYRDILLDEVVETLAVLLPELPRLASDTRTGIARKALWGLNSSKPLDANAIWGRVLREHSTYLRRTSERFHVYCSLAVRRAQTRRQGQLGQARIHLLPSLPPRVARSFDELDPGGDRWNEEIHAQQPVRLTVQARSPADAVEIGSAELDFLRGLWNWRVNRPIISRSGGALQPINSIRVGPRYTVHRPGGKLAVTQYWYEPAYVSPVVLKTISALDWKGTVREELRVRRLIGRIRYGEELREAFVRYARALDTADFQVSLLRLWGLLELLTGSQREDHTTVVKRCSSIFADSVHAQASLGLIRQQRNRLAHSGHTTGNDQHYAMQLRRFIDQLLKVHLGMGRHFESLPQFGQFLDLSREPGALKEAIRVRQLALKFHSV